MRLFAKGVTISILLALVLALGLGLVVAAPAAADDVYIGDPGSAAAQNVWDSNFKFVSHMGDDPDSSHIKDSTQHGNDGTKKDANEPIEADGEIGKAQHFDGDDDCIDFPQVSLDEWTAEFRVKADNWGALGDEPPFIAKAADTADYLWYSPSLKKLRTKVGGTSYDFPDTWEPDALQDYRLTFTYDEINYKVYVDAALHSTVAEADDDPIELDRIGKITTVCFLDGILDEVRISDIARSPAWIKASYESGRDNLLVFGVEESLGEGWLSAWTKRIPLIIDKDDIDEALTDFPILVYLDDDVSFIFDEIGSDLNRKEIAVTTSDGATQCYVEIEKWDTANKQAWLWVKVPEIASDAGTTLYLYYSKEAAEAGVPIPEAMLMMGIAGLALWQKELPFYIIAFLCAFFIGTLWYDVAWQYGISAMLLAFFLLYRGVMQAVVGNIQY